MTLLLIVRSLLPCLAHPALKAPQSHGAHWRSAEAHASHPHGLQPEPPGPLNENLSTGHDESYPKPTRKKIPSLNSEFFWPCFVFNILLETGWLKPKLAPTLFIHHYRMLLFHALLHLLWAITSSQLALSRIPPTGRTWPLETQSCPTVFNPQHILIISSLYTKKYKKYVIVTLYVVHVPGATKRREFVVCLLWLVLIRRQRLAPRKVTSPVTAVSLRTGLAVKEAKIEIMPRHVSNCKKYAIWMCS